MSQHDFTPLIVPTGDALLERLLAAQGEAAAEDWRAVTLDEDTEPAVRRGPALAGRFIARDDAPAAMHLAYTVAAGDRASLDSIVASAQLIESRGRLAAVRWRRNSEGRIVGQEIWWTEGTTTSATEAA